MKINKVVGDKVSVMIIIKSPVKKKTWYLITSRNKDKNEKGRRKKKKTPPRIKKNKHKQKQTQTETNTNTNTYTTISQNTKKESSRTWTTKKKKGKRKKKEKFPPNKNFPISKKCLRGDQTSAAGVFSQALRLGKIFNKEPPAISSSARRREIPR